MSIDEKAAHKGHGYATILSDESSGVVLDVIAGRSDESVEELYQTALSTQQRADVKTVCDDMWQPYTKGIASTDEQHFKLEAINSGQLRSFAGVPPYKEKFPRYFGQRRLNRKLIIAFYMWKRNAKGAKIKVVDEVVEMFERHEKGILNAIRTGANNARAERLNSAIQAPKNNWKRVQKH